MYGPESGSLDNKEKQKYVDACPKAAISKVKLGTGDGGRGNSRAAAMGM